MAGEALPLLILQSEQPSGQFADRRLGLPPFSQVPRDLCETGEFARVITHGGDDDVCPESRAVFAHAPALIFHPPFHLCLTEQLRWTTALLVFGCVEPCHRLADDFTAIVTLDETSAFVPRHDFTVGIEHENRVVLDTRDQQTAQLVFDAGVQRSVRLLHDGSPSGGCKSYHYQNRR